MKNAETDIPSVLEVSRLSRGLNISDTLLTLKQLNALPHGDARIRKYFIISAHPHTLIRFAAQFKECVLIYNL